MNPWPIRWAPLCSVGQLSAFVLVVGSLVVGCGVGPRIRSRAADIQTMVDVAERNGAKKCAPRELALAQAYLEFASFELAEGSLARAEEKLAEAEVNARSAIGQSPPEHCSSRPSLPGDQDGDGLPDSSDPCPQAAENYNGYQDEDGCPDDPDTDADGIPDSRDSCVTLAEDEDGYEDDDGCPDWDNDLDGVPDSADQCPRDAEDPDGYEDHDGCPDLDNDGDGVPDLDDQCPNTPGPSDADPKGCPQRATLVVVTDCEVKITQQIHFETGRDKLRTESHPILNAVVEVLENNTSIKLQIQGHTDDVGTNKNNLDLSERRAASVKKYLVSRGVAADRLESKGFGEETPLVPNDSKDNRSLNRRVQFMRTEGEKADCGEAKSQAGSATSPP